MAKIELLFGGPNNLKDEIEIEKDAYAWDICIETAVIRRFRRLINGLSITRKNGDNFFSLLLYIECNQMLKLPKISSGVYRHNGFVLPKLIIHGDHGIDQKSEQSVLLSDKHINGIGKGFEEEIGFEYFEYTRTGSINNLSNAPIYLLGKEAHIYDGGKFYKAKTQ
jgi:hypothetical protein